MLHLASAHSQSTLSQFDSDQVQPNAIDLRVEAGLSLARILKRSGRLFVRRDCSLAGIIMILNFFP